MNRSRRVPQTRHFVSGGIYDPRQSYAIQQGNQGGQYQTRQNYDNKAVRNDKIQQQQQQQQQQESAEQQQQKYENSQPPPLEPPPQPPKMEDDTAEEDIKLEDSGLYDESGKLQYKNIFRTRKKSSVRAKEKKIRQNRQLRKTLIPKNALMALNEVVGLTISEFTITNASGGGFVAVVTVNEKQYEGKGHSKIAAKNNASEKALRDYVLEKMREKPRLRKNSVNNDEPVNEMAGDTNNEAVSENGDDGQQDNVGTTALMDDVPMVNLASFAIYKLFTEWENEGYVVPELRVAHAPQTGNGNDSCNGDGIPQTKQPKAPPIRSELPNNWESIHPSTLLCMMRPGLQYREIGTVGDPPNVLQRMGVTVDEVDYESSGRSKKIARRNVAVCVLNELFGTNFIKEPPFEE